MNYYNYYQLLNSYSTIFDRKKQKLSMVESIII